MSEHEKTYYWNTDGTDVEFQEKQMVDHDQYGFQDLAQDAARVFWEDHDGWEAEWPRKFTIMDENNDELATVTIEQEFDPCFTAGEVKFAKDRS